MMKKDAIYKSLLNIEGSAKKEPKTVEFWIVDFSVELCVSTANFIENHTKPKIDIHSALIHFLMITPPYN